LIITEYAKKSDTQSIIFPLITKKIDLMKKTIICTCLFFCTIFFLNAQSEIPYTFDNELPETYINLILDSKTEIEALALEFSVDNAILNPHTGKYEVRLWVARKDYQRFHDLNIPYSLFEAPHTESKAVTMAYSYNEMITWNKYPTYSTYLAMMDTFQKRYPNLCKIDTILAATPDNHMIIAAHISNTLNTPSNKPEFLYTSTMHGDEVTGYYCMLRLIDYLLSNYETDARVANIVNNINLWICPNENPDGTYYSGNNIIGSSPTSTRANSNGVDLNRSYPHPMQYISTLEPEIAAMINFVEQHHFVLSANFHGGAELANYPWDGWRSQQHSHADDAWWQYVCRNYADSCQYYGNSGYFNDQNDGITNGGDWYVIYGSRQDYLNYYVGCREMTVEISSNKTPSASNLPSFWNANKSSLLSYIEESLYRFRGLVFDAYTEDPLHAEVFINQHDEMNTQVYSHLPIGNYHRPIKAGTYNVTFSAEGYCPRTFDITVQDHHTLVFHVALTPCDSNGNIIPDSNNHVQIPTIPDFGEEEVADMDAADSQLEIGVNEATNGVTGITDKYGAAAIKVYPNPTKNHFYILYTGALKENSISYQLTDIYGKEISAAIIHATITEVPISSFPSGIYILLIREQNRIIESTKIIKN